MPRKILLLGTQNKNKIKEIKRILFGVKYKIVSLKDLGINQEIEETGKTYEENAVIKARQAGKETGILTLAEDTGLEVEYLDGAPGIHTKRYARGADADRNNKLLKDLKGVRKDKRKSRFICIAAVYNPENGKAQTFEGISNGFITEKPAGKSGFGYDPVFFNSDLNKTNAQASDEEKDKVSHRGRAILKVKKYLEKLKF